MFFFYFAHRPYSGWKTALPTSGSTGVALTSSSRAAKISRALKSEEIATKGGINDANLKARFKGQRLTEAQLVLACALHQF